MNHSRGNGIVALCSAAKEASTCSDSLKLCLPPLTRCSGVLLLNYSRL